MSDTPEKVKRECGFMNRRRFKKVRDAVDTDEFVDEYCRS
jgi:hypothetical protein